MIEKVYNINVVHEFAPNNEGHATLLPEDYTIKNLKPNTEKSITAEAVTGYVAYPSVQNVTVVDKDITVTFQYYKNERLERMAARAEMLWLLFLYYDILDVMSW